MGAVVVAVVDVGVDAVASAVDWSGWRTHSPRLHPVGGCSNCHPPWSRSSTVEFRGNWNSWIAPMADGGWCSTRR